MPSIILNIIIIILEIRALTLCFPERKLKMLIFYTQISNMITTVSSVMLLIAGQQDFVTPVRYLGTCMMVMTFFVTVCVLVPMGGDPKMLLWSKSGLILHILCPALTTVSFLFFEKQVGWEMLLLPVGVTLAYGLIMIILNAARLVEGPYPFFWVYKQTVSKTILWILALLGVITGLSALVCLIKSYLLYIV